MQSTSMFVLYVIDTIFDNVNVNVYRNNIK